MKTKPRVIIVHGWASSPRRGWIAKLAADLKTQGYDVKNPALPKPRRPEISEWVIALQKAVGRQKHLILVGHSLGTYVLLEFIKSLPADVKIDKLILVAGFYVTDQNTYWPNYHLNEVDFKKIRKQVKKTWCIYSTNDRMVEPNRTRALAQKMDAELIMQIEMRHFSNLRLEELPLVEQIITQLQ